MNAIVAERGQVTIPKAIRERLGIRPAFKLSFSVAGDKMVAEKAGETASAGHTAKRIDRSVVGCLKTDKSSDELMREVREWREAW